MERVDLNKTFSPRLRGKRYPIESVIISAPAEPSTVGAVHEISEQKVKMGNNRALLKIFTTYF